MRKITFASLGDLCIDNYLKYNKFFPGGTAFNTAVSAKRAGANASIFSAVGTDYFAQVYTEAFKLYDIDSSPVKILSGKCSSIKVDSNDQGQRIFSEWEIGVLKDYYLDSNDEKRLKQYDIAKMTLFKPLHKLFDEFCLLDLPSTIKAADFAGSSTYSDDIISIQKYIDKLNIVVKSFNEQEKPFLSIFQEMSVEHIGKVFLALLGENGSIAFLNGKQYKQPAKKTVVKDTNGAGDAYIAHFLVSYFIKRSIPQAMIDGSKAASKKIRSIGSV